MLKGVKLNIPERTTMTPNGAFVSYRQTRVLDMTMMEQLYNERVIYKKKMLQDFNKNLKTQKMKSIKNK